MLFFVWQFLKVVICVSSYIYILLTINDFFAKNEPKRSESEWGLFLQKIIRGQGVQVLAKKLEYCKKIVYIVLLAKCHAVWCEIHTIHSSLCDIADFSWSLEENAQVSYILKQLYLQRIICHQLRGILNIRKVIMKLKL